MAHSKRFKDQASSAKRIATSLNKIIEEWDYPGIIHKSASISQTDRATLLKAATILRRIGSEKEKIAKTEKSSELKRDELIAKTTIEAAEALAGWKTQETILDKVSLILSSNGSYSLERYLVEGVFTIGRAAVAKDWQDTFNDLFNDAIREIPGSVAYHSVTRNKSLDEVLNALSEKITALKNHSKARSLAEQWASKINTIPQI